MGLEKLEEKLELNVENIRGRLRSYGIPNTYNLQNSKNKRSIKNEVKKKFELIYGIYFREIMKDRTIKYARIKLREENNSCEDCGSKEVSKYGIEYIQSRGLRDTYHFEEEGGFSYCFGCGKWEPRNR